MNHLAEEQLYEALFADKPLSAEDQRHLADCQRCQQQWSALSRLGSELSIAAQSQISPAQRQRYLHLGHQIQRQPSAWARLVTHLQQMTLTLDNRQRAGMQGIRSGSTHSYRLLYSATSAEVELLVEAQGPIRRIEGEVLPLDPESLRTPVLVELSQAESQHQHEDLVTESTLQGRFHFESVPIGYYSLMITPMEGPYLQIEGIDLT